MNDSPFLQFLTNFSLDSVWVVVKAFFLLGLGIYLVFALVMIRQVQLMISTLDGTLNLPLKVIAWIHLGAAVAVVLIAAIVL